MVTNKSKRYFFRVSCNLRLCACAECIGSWHHLTYLILTKSTMQQYFHPSAKHLLYRYITPSFAGHYFRVNARETWYFFDN